jgi:hypothetical protein
MLEDQGNLRMRKNLKMFKFAALLLCTIAILFGAQGIRNYASKKKQAENYKVFRVVGGLGNQMFIYAAGFAFSKELNCEILYEKDFYDRQTSDKDNRICYRVYSLDFFNTNAKIATKEQTEKCTKIVDEDQVKSKGISYFKENNHELFVGYFQDLSYFEKYRKDILKAFSLKAPLNDANKKMMKEIKNNNSVSLHIRKTDYLNFSYIFSSCDMESYYELAIKYLTERVENPHFYVFSDDIDWVKNNFKTDCPYTIVDINDDSANYFDLELMKNCKHNIIANSTFSWWGAWLNNNPEKTVVAPKNWYQGDPNDKMIPKEWVRI